MTDLAQQPVETAEEEPRPSLDEQVLAAIDAREAAQHTEPDPGQTDEDDDPLVASAETPVEAPSVPEEPSQEPSETERAEATRLYNYMRSNPQMADTLVAIERGDAIAVPKQVLEAAQQMRQQPQEPQTDPDEEMYADPFAYMKKIETRLSQREQADRQAFEHRAKQQAEHNFSLLESTGQEWHARHPELSETDLIGLINNQVGPMHLVKHYLSQHGDPKKAISDAFDAAHRIAYPNQQITPQQMAQNTRAKRRAGATAASPRTSPRMTPEEPKTKQEKINAIAEIIRESREAN